MTVDVKALERALLVKKLSRAIMMGTGWLLCSLAAWHIAGLWGVFLVQGLILRGKL